MHAPATFCCSLCACMLGLSPMQISPPVMQIEMRREIAQLKEALESRVSVLSSAHKQSQSPDPAMAQQTQQARHQLWSKRLHPDASPDQSHPRAASPAAVPAASLSLPPPPPVAAAQPPVSAPAAVPAASAESQQPAAAVTSPPAAQPQNAGLPSFYNLIGPSPTAVPPAQSGAQTARSQPPAPSTQPAAASLTLPPFASPAPVQSMQPPFQQPPALDWARGGATAAETGSRPGSASQASFGLPPSHAQSGPRSEVSARRSPEDRSADHRNKVIRGCCRIAVWHACFSLHHICPNERFASLTRCQ